jgi:hypothetical protein
MTRDLKPPNNHPNGSRNPCLGMVSFACIIMDERSAKDDIVLFKERQASIASQHIVHPSTLLISKVQFPTTHPSFSSSSPSQALPLRCKCNRSSLRQRRAMTSTCSGSITLSSTIFIVGCGWVMGLDHCVTRAVPPHVSPYSPWVRISVSSSEKVGASCALQAAMGMAVERSQVLIRGQFVANDVRAGSESLQGSLSTKLWSRGSPDVIVWKSSSVKGVS